MMRISSDGAVKAFIVIWVLWALVWLGMVAGLVYVAGHFIG